MAPKDSLLPVVLFTALLVSGLSSSLAEENCLPAPNARAPEGSHWYYRTDPTSQNKCWHLRAEGQPDEQSIRPQKPEQAGASTAAAPPPLPRPAPNGLRQRSNSLPTDQAGSGASVRVVDPAAAQSGAELRRGPSGNAASPPPAAPATNTNVWGDPPSATVTAPALSPPSSDNALAWPSTQPSADENNAGAQAPLKERPDAGQKQQRLASDSAKPEKEVPTDDEAASYKLTLLAMLFIILVAGVIVVGIFIRALVRMGLARRQAKAAEESSADLPAEAEKTQTSEGALRGLLQILEHEPHKARRSAKPYQ
jgi:hypothetical protein